MGCRCTYPFKPVFLVQCLVVSASDPAHWFPVELRLRIDDTPCDLLVFPSNTTGEDYPLVEKHPRTTKAIRHIKAGGRMGSTSQETTEEKEILRPSARTLNRRLPYRDDILG